MDLKPADINDHIGMKNLNPEEAEIILETDPASTPAEFKDIPRNVDPESFIPFQYRLKTHRDSRKNFKMAKKLKSSFHQLKKYREYK